MLNIWNKSDPDIAGKISQYQEKHCKEVFDPRYIEVFQSDLSPYEGYVFYKIIHKSHRIIVNKSASSNRFDIIEGTISFALIEMDGSKIENVIPIERYAGFVYALNRSLNLKISESNVIKYTRFFGQIVSVHREEFNFFSSLEELDRSLNHLDSESKQKVTNFVTSTYAVSQDGGLDLQVKKKTFPFLGTSFRFSIPVIFEGKINSTKMNVSEKGYITMVSDSPTTIVELDRAYIRTMYYSFEASDANEAIMRKYLYFEGRLQKGFNILFLAERVTSIIATSAIFFPIFVWYSNSSSRDVLNPAYQLADKSLLIGVVALLLGAFLVIAVFMRYAFFEVSYFTAKLVPSKFSYIYDRIKMETRMIANRVGIYKFIPLMFLELAMGVATALTVFIYGLNNGIMTKLLYVPYINIVHALEFIYLSSSLPFITTWLWKPKDVESYAALTNLPVLSWIIAFYVGTITVSVTYRVFQIIRKNDSEE